MRYSVEDAAAPSDAQTQFYSMLGSRGIWHDGWKAVTTHPTISGWSHFNDDTWELYHTDADRAELHDLAAEHPDKLRELVNLWFAEAGANDAFPLDDRSALEIITTPRPQLAPPRDRYVYYPGTAEVPEAQAVNVRNRSYTIGAVVDIPAPGAEGVLFAHGSRFGGHALYVKDNRLHYVYNFVGMLEQKIDGTEDLPTGENLILSASFDKDGEDPPHVSTGILSLYHGDKKVGEGRIKTQPGMFSLAGEGLCVGRDSGEPVTDDYPGEHAVGASPEAPSAGRRRRERRPLYRSGARGSRDDDEGVNLWTTCCGEGLPLRTLQQVLCASRGSSEARLGTGGQRDAAWRRDPWRQYLEVRQGRFTPGLNAPDQRLNDCTFADTRKQGFVCEPLHRCRIPRR